jgi:hypothetical protein
MEWHLCQKLEHCKRRIALGELIEAVGQESERVECLQRRSAPASKATLR